MSHTLLIGAGIVAVILLAMCNLSFAQSACEDTASLNRARWHYEYSTGCMVEGKDGQWRRVFTAAEDSRRRTVVVHGAE